MSNRILFGEPIELELPEEMLPLSDLIVPDLKTKSLRETRFQVYIIRNVFRQIVNHLSENSQIETGGVLIGQAFRCIDKPNIQFVVIIGAIRQDSANRGTGYFTVGPGDIARARTEMENQYPGLTCVGWYHSHPGHGVFLSGQDMTIVRSIYNAEWHVALVIDPQRREAAFFRGSAGERLAGWLELNNKPKSIEVISAYNRAIEAQSAGDHRQIEKFKEWLVSKTNHPELSHWVQAKRYQNLSLEMQFPIHDSERQEDFRKGSESAAPASEPSEGKLTVGYQEMKELEEIKNKYSSQRKPGFSPTPLTRLFGIVDLAIGIKQSFQNPRTHVLGSTSGQLQDIGDRDSKK